MKRTPGRPPRLGEEDIVAIDGLHAKSVLQENSERKAMIVHILNVGGRAKVRELTEDFGYDVRPRLRSLIGSGWLCHVRATQWKGKVSMPRRANG